MCKKDCRKEAQPKIFQSHASKMENEILQSYASKMAIDPAAVRKAAAGAAAAIVGGSTLSLVSALKIMQDHLDDVLPPVVRSTSYEDEDEATVDQKPSPSDAEGCSTTDLLDNSYFYVVFDPDKWDDMRRDEDFVTIDELSDEEPGIYVLGTTEPLLVIDLADEGWLDDCEEREVDDDDEVEVERLLRLLENSQDQADQLVELVKRLLPQPMVVEAGSTLPDGFDYTL